MDVIDRERRNQRANAQRNSGVNPEMARFVAAQVGVTGHEAEILALPIWVGNQVPLQSAAGNQLFVFGLSAWGGSDEFG